MLPESGAVDLSASHPVAHMLVKDRWRSRGVTAAEAQSPRFPARPAARGSAVRGEFVDIGGRRLRIVRAGPAQSARPTVVLEHGAFGCASDWQVVQDRLAAKGLRSLAYDRAGLGF